ncbi:pentapeptide repeat-containing protein [Clostridium perfringens]|uniref:pentapeptide repeat-containing protein n=2 Tax=Clostridium perfringens TaxID=1502 RepID=UPI0024BC4EA0|nr:pentapeptide repeat-containing protein [Clostridium perfringens]
MAYKKKEYKSSKSQEEKRKDIDFLVKQADEKIDKVFSSSNDLKEYLSFMAKFHNYSYRNSILIEEQFRGAVAVGSFAFWKEKGYSVNKGEKGIKILVPTKLGDRFIAEDGTIKLISKANEKEKQLIRSGELETLEGAIKFKQGYVFDVSQTNMPSSELPKIFPNKWLEGDVKNYKAFYKSLENVASKIGVKIIEPKSELGLVKGVSYTSTREVALNPRNSELQNVKTLIHELAHAKLHTVETRDNYTKAEKEFQAEMVALSVSSYFGINTEEYSLRYLSEWTKNATFKDKEKLLKEVSTTVKEYVEIMEDSLNAERELTKENEKIIKIKDEINKEGNMKKYKLDNDISEKIRKHELWLESNKKKGERLDLEGRDLRGVRFLNVNLKEANFKNSDLEGAIFFANLTGANLEGTNLKNTKFIGSNIKDIIIEPNKLERINLEISEELEFHNKMNKTLKTNNKEKSKSKENNYEIEF